MDAPLWLAMVTGIGGLVLGNLLPSVLGHIKSNRDRKQAGATAANEDARAREANALEASGSNRELLMRALDLSVSDDPKQVARAWTILEAVAGMQNVSPDDARLCRLLRVQLAGELGGPYVAQLEASGEEVVPYVDSDLGQGDHGAQELDQGQSDQVNEAGAE